MRGPAALHAFAGYGIELEYMIVERRSLAVLPIADQLLRTKDGHVSNELSHGHFAWSNEVVLHLIELKNVQPDPTLGPLASGFHAEVRVLNAALEPLGACLMPTAMHPWMNPARETRLWPHEHAAIYSTYDRIFDCKRHGWANLQSMHLNLPFSDDAEFTRLHAAIRLVLPILPAIASSSPFADGHSSGFLDYRLENYRNHQIKVPATIGRVIPDTAQSIDDYRAHVLSPMYDAIAPLDPDTVLRNEWLNARGVIPRFDRNALEIRIIDVQECPQADLAIAAATSAVVKSLYDSSDPAQQTIATDKLVAIFTSCIRDADQAIISDANFLTLLGYPGDRCTAGELWCFLIERHLQPSLDEYAHWQEPLDTILEQGPLARRILNTVGQDRTRSALETVYRELCNCLEAGRMFESDHD